MATQPFAAVYRPTSNARNDRRGHVAELRVRIAVLNGYAALGMPVTEAWNDSIVGKGSHGYQIIHATTEPRSIIRGRSPFFRRLAAVRCAFRNVLSIIIVSP